MSATTAPWKAVGTTVRLPNVAGGFDLRGCPDPEALARRIVACVNACAGSALEQDAAPGLLERLQADNEAADILANAIEKTNDSLREQLAAAESKVGALMRERDERFENHTKAVAEWVSELAETLGLMGDGPFKPENLLEHARQGREWAAEMQAKVGALMREKEELRERLLKAFGHITRLEGMNEQCAQIAFDKQMDDSGNPWDAGWNQACTDIYNEIRALVREQQPPPKKQLSAQAIAITVDRCADD